MQSYLTLNVARKVEPMTPQDQTVQMLDGIEAELRARFEDMAAIPIDPAQLAATLIVLGDEYNEYYASSVIEADD